MTDPFQLPAGTRIGGVSLTVRNLDRSLSFYSQVLGFHLLQRQGDEASFSAGFDSAPLIRLCERPGANVRPSGTSGLYHLAILYPSRKALGTALHTLLRQEYPVRGASNHGVSEAIYLRDPDGNGVELYRDRPKEQWPRTPDGGLAMFTHPLDSDSLLREADGEVSKAHP